MGWIIKKKIVTADFLPGVSQYSVDLLQNSDREIWS